MFDKFLINTSKEEIDSILKKGVGECQNFTNKLYGNLLFNLLEEKNSSEQKLKNLLQFTLINRINILQQNCINIFTNETMKNETSYSYTVTDISMNLNSFYLHLSGLIDNLGWYIEYKYQVLDLNLEDKKNRKQIGLSKKRNKNFYKELKIKNNETYSIIRQYQNWLDDLHEKRDPITHRMPLYVPPTVVVENKAEFIPVYSLNKDKLIYIIPSIVNDSFKLHNMIIELINSK